MRGRMASLLEVGTGFHPELSGRENIYLNGAILGMSRREISRRFDEIIAFAEIERFLDTPVKRYSSGMYVRLAFAVAAHLDSDILVVDEVLAVGDAAFQKKCLGKMGTATQTGRTVLFVSHNLAALSTLCPRSILLHHGTLLQEGPTESVIADYLGQHFMTTGEIDLADRSDRTGTGLVRLTRIELEGSEGGPIHSATCGGSCHILFHCEVMDAAQQVELSYTIRDSRGQFLMRPSTQDHQAFLNLPNGNCVIRCTIPRLPLIPGEYRLTVEIVQYGELLDYIEGAYILNVESGLFFGVPLSSQHSPVLLDHAWTIQGDQ